ncbi:hypothetical protein [Natronobacterium lacisalsi]|uniref:hypothetical protein n=1 Tax=Natronobacterium lacisalsi TaxID=229731 RepID=UPI0012EC40E0|nr:hypothetical protein [Halobiforma lacisalsi]
MSDVPDETVIGAAGGAGAVAGGAIAAITEGSLVLGLVSSAAAGAILSGSIALALSARR